MSTKLPTVQISTEDNFVKKTDMLGEGEKDVFPNLFRFISKTGAGCNGAHLKNDRQCLMANVCQPKSMLSDCSKASPLNSIQTYTTIPR